MTQHISTFFYIRHVMIIIYKLTYVYKSLVKFFLAFDSLLFFELFCFIKYMIVWWVVELDPKLDPKLDSK